LRQEALAGLQEAPDDVERLQRELWLVLVLLTPVRREEGEHEHTEQRAAEDGAQAIPHAPACSIALSTPNT
jgi:hypothetical protein